MNKKRVLMFTVMLAMVGTILFTAPQKTSASDNLRYVITIYEPDCINGGYLGSTYTNIQSFVRGYGYISFYIDGIYYEYRNMPVAITSEVSY